MKGPGKLGQDTGKKRGPEPGEGASSVGGMVAGDSDMEGTPPDQLPRHPRESIDRKTGTPDQPEHDREE